MEYASAPTKTVPIAMRVRGATTWLVLGCRREAAGSRAGSEGLRWRTETGRRWGHLRTNGREHGEEW